MLESSVPGYLRSLIISFFVMFAVAGVEEAGRSPIISLGGDLLVV